MAQPELPGCVRLGPEELTQRAERLKALMAPCRICPRMCSANRTAGERGKCGAGAQVEVSGVDLHFGEEAYLVGRGGSGTVFFTHCSLRCKFCQNHLTSIFGQGMGIGNDGLAQAFLLLQDQGAENLNLVTPTHYAADILETLALAVRGGFRLPVVYNTSSYDSVDILAQFEGVIDIYLADLKFADAKVGAGLTDVSDYTTVAPKALLEMVRQVGPGLRIERGVAKRGMSIRHLVLPGRYSDSKRCLELLAGISSELAVNLMVQYRPGYNAMQIPGMDQGIDWVQYREVADYGRGIGLVNLASQ